MSLHPDYQDILSAFAAQAVEYVVVDGYAMGFHGQPRFTKDLDLWVRSDVANMERVRLALEADWDGIDVSIVSRDELIRLKRASGRPQDLLDAAMLEAKG